MFQGLTNCLKSKIKQLEFDQVMWILVAWHSDDDMKDSYEILSREDVIFKRKRTVSSPQKMYGSRHFLNVLSVDSGYVHSPLI